MCFHIYASDIYKDAVDELFNTEVKASTLENKRDKEGLIIAVGRIHRLSNISSQIRYFAVDRNYRKQGIGTYLMNHLEKVSLDEKRPCMILNARENAVSFYKKLDYHITEKSNLLYGKIQHYRMKKNIQSNKIY